jgi:hypothetical protein
MNNVKAVWQFAFPSGITMTGEGYVARFEPVDAPVNAAQQAEVGWVWAGPVTTVTGA